MKLNRYLFFLCMFLIGPTAFAEELGFIRLSLIQGDAQVLIRDSTDWAPAVINLPMNEQDRLWVPDNGRAELQMRGGAYVRPGGNTALDVLTVNPDSVQFYLDQGHVYLNNRRAGISTVQIDTAVASVRAYDDSVIMLDVTPEGTNEISVLKGTVHAEIPSGATTVNAGNTLTISGNAVQLSPIGTPDEWEQWNIDRDREVPAWTGSSRYLPADLDEYASDFDEYGRWEYNPEYGYVWFPAVTALNWSPYSYGNWVWIRGSYVWIDYDPWGWATSHYGRWLFTGRGWCWVPPAAGAAYWAPGYVGWVVTPSYVAWVPLAPGELYYGYGYYGPESANITTITINSAVVNRDYRNARIAGSVTVVRRDTFGTGRRTPVRVTVNPFETTRRHRDVQIAPPPDRPRQDIVIAPPEGRKHTERMIRERERIRQQTASGTPPSTVPRQRRPSALSGGNATSPSARSSSQARHLPPERVRRTSTEELKNQRPLVKQPAESVFKSRRPGDLAVTRSRQPRVIIREPAAGTSPQQPQQNRQEQTRGNREKRQRQ